MNLSKELKKRVGPKLLDKDTINQFTLHCNSKNLYYAFKYTALFYVFCMLVQC